MSATRTHAAGGLSCRQIGTALAAGLVVVGVAVATWDDHSEGLRTETGVCLNGIAYTAYYVPRKAVELAAGERRRSYRVDAIAIPPHTIWVADDSWLSRDLLDHECRHLGGDMREDVD